MITSCLPPSLRATSAAVFGFVVVCAGGAVWAQDAQPPAAPPPSAPPPGEPPPSAPPTTTPPPQGKAPQPHEQTQPQEYSAKPSEASAGGAERKLPDYAGLFPGSPVSLIEPPIKGLEKWTSDNLRLDLGFRAAWGFQQASAGSDPGSDRTAASQDYRIYGTLHLFNFQEENKGWAGNVYFRTEWRAEMFTKIPPFQLNTQIGTLFTTTYSQDEHDPALVQLYYEQFLFDGGLRLRAGKIDPDDYFNLGRWADDYRYFDNALFSAFPASNHPSGGLGFNAQWYVTPEWTLTGGMSDVQGKKTLSGFDTIGDGRFFYGADVTYSPTIRGLGKGNYRFGYEHRDAVPWNDKPEDDSWYFNIDQEVVKDVAPFFRLGWGTGRSTEVTLVVSGGIGIENCFQRPGDAWGLGFGFDKASSEVDSNRDYEYAAETFYRFQLSRAMQFTLGGQLILNPIKSNQDVVGIFEMRLVIDF
jgi:hypothetical protein